MFDYIQKKKRKKEKMCYFFFFFLNIIIYRLLREHEPTNYTRPCKAISSYAMYKLLLFTFHFVYMF